MRFLHKSFVEAVVACCKSVVSLSEFRRGGISILSEYFVKGFYVKIPYFICDTFNCFVGVYKQSHTVFYTNLLKIFRKGNAYNSFEFCTYMGDGIIIFVADSVESDIFSIFHIDKLKDILYCVISGKNLYICVYGSHCVYKELDEI